MDFEPPHSSSLSVFRGCLVAGEQERYAFNKGIRRVLKVAGHQLPAKKRGLSADLAYLDSDHKADIDWADPTARAAQLKVLVRDAEATLDLALQQADDPGAKRAALC